MLESGGEVIIPHYTTVLYIPGIFTEVVTLFDVYLLHVWYFDTPYSILSLACPLIVLPPCRNSACRYLIAAMTCGEEVKKTPTATRDRVSLILTCSKAEEYRREINFECH